jgi:hypothetical protein
MSSGTFGFDNIEFFPPEEPFKNTKSHEPLLVRFDVKYDAGDNIYVTIRTMEESDSDCFVSITPNQARLMAKFLLLCADAADMEGVSC